MHDSFHQYKKKIRTISWNKVRQTVIQYLASIYNENCIKTLIKFVCIHKCIEISYFPCFVYVLNYFMFGIWYNRMNYIFFLTYIFDLQTCSNLQRTRQSVQTFDWTPAIRMYWWRCVSLSAQLIYGKRTNTHTHAHNKRFKASSRHFMVNCQWKLHGNVISVNCMHASTTPSNRDR